MRDNVGLNSRLQKFCSILAASDGSISIVEAYRRAGYANDSSNANAAYKKLLAGGWLQAERERLGLPPIGQEGTPEIDDAAQAALLEQARATYAMAVAQSDTKSMVKATRIIERALKPKRAPGRPTSTPQAKTPAASERDSARADALVSAFLLPEDEEEIEAIWGDSAPPWGRVLQTRVEDV